MCEGVNSACELEKSAFRGLEVAFGMIAILEWDGNLFSIYNGLKRVYDQPILISYDAIAQLREAFNDRGVIR